MSNRLPKFDKDSAYRRRGGTAQWLLLACGACKENMCLYQKDGPGQLLRLYLDRIADSEGGRPFRNLGEDDIRPLTCGECNNDIGVPMTYKKDSAPRTALRLVDASVDKHVLQNRRQLEEAGSTDVMATMASMVLRAE